MRSSDSSYRTLIGSEVGRCVHESATLRLTQRFRTSYTRIGKFAVEITVEESEIRIKVDSYNQVSMYSRNY